MDAERSTLLTEAARIGFPAVFYSSGAQHLAGERAWRDRLAAVAPADLPGIKVQLESHAGQFDRAAAFEAAEASREARMVEREGPPTASESRAAATIRAEAAEAVARHRAAHGDRVEALLTEMLAELKRMG